MNQFVLKTTNLTKGYGPFPVLNGLNLELPQGKIIGLLGPNGSGKTTLIKLIAGLLTPDAGGIEVCGVPAGVQTKALVSYLPDRTYFDQNMRVSQQLDYFSDFYEDFDRARAQAMLQDLQIPLNVKFRTLSKGAREKVQLVLVMSRRARLYLLDEPIAGVDPAAREYILQPIVQNFDPSATVVISTHLSPTWSGCWMTLSSCTRARSSGAAMLTPSGRRQASPWTSFSGRCSDVCHIIKA